MVRTFGLHTYFLTFSCGELWGNELVFTIFMQHGNIMSEEEIEILSYSERCGILNENPVTLARRFQYSVKYFFKTIVIDNPLGKKHILCCES